MIMGSLSVQTKSDDFSEDLKTAQLRYFKRPEFFPCTACGRFFTNRAMLVHKRTCLETPDCQCSACKSDSKMNKFKNILNLKSFKSIPILKSFESIPKLKSFESIPKLKSLESIPNLKTLEGFQNFKSFESTPFDSNAPRRDPEKRQIKMTPRMRDLLMNRVKYNNSVDNDKLLTFKLIEENSSVIDKMVGENVLDTNENENNHNQESASPPSETSENSDIQATESFGEVKMKIDHECDRKLFCCFCNSHFYWELFGSHVIQHCQAMPNNFLKCPNTECERSFSTPALFLTHYMIHNCKHPLECSDCKCSDITCCSTSSPTKEHSLGDSEFYHCYICLANFNHPQTVINHMRLHSKERPFKCTECNRSFRQVGNLQRHITTHRGDRPYNCPECDKSFADPATLRNHERVHTKETPYKCAVCHRSFTQIGNLKRHLTLHMKKQQSSISLSAAIRSTTSEIDHVDNQDSCDNSNSESDFIINDVGSLCDVKSKNRKKKGKMKVFSCKICKKVYAWKHDLEVHFRTHTGEKPYKCDVCGKKFAQSGAVRIHKARHHVGSNDSSTKQKR